jgi:hypothetical protein
MWLSLRSEASCCQVARFPTRSALLKRKSPKSINELGVELFDSGSETSYNRGIKGSLRCQGLVGVVRGLC